MDLLRCKPSLILDFTLLFEKPIVFANLPTLLVLFQSLPLFDYSFTAMITP